MRPVTGRSGLTSTVLVLLALAWTSASPVSGKLKTWDPADLTNFVLGPEYAQWLVGPIAHIATKKERESYLALTDDEAAAQFIERFWERRGPNLEFPPRGPRIVFERRAEEADRLFTEGTHLGRRTDRGTVFILYGSPSSIEYADPARPGEEPVIVWNYPRGADKGLDGKRPDRRYGFRREDRVTELYPVAGLRNLRKLPSSDRRNR